MEIRNFTKNDVKSVAKLVPQLTVNIFNKESLEQRIEKILNEEHTQAIIAENEGNIVGFAMLACYTIPSKGVIGWIEEVVVDESVRGQGIGRKLMEELLKIAAQKGCQQIKLTAANFIAQKLYESLGFTFKETEVMIKKM